MRRHEIGMLAMISILALVCAGIGCSRNSSITYKDSVKKALEQADLRDVSVSEDESKNTISLSGTLHSEEAKNRAGEIAQSSAGNRVVANEISVEPVGSESQARQMESNLDDGIESNYKAGLIAKGIEKQHIRYKAKNGVLTLTGSVHNPAMRKQAEELAQNTPNVNQVVNQLEVRR